MIYRLKCKIILYNGFESRTDNARYRLWIQIAESPIFLPDSVSDHITQTDK